MSWRGLSADGRGLCMADAIADGGPSRTSGRERRCALLIAASRRTALVAEVNQGGDMVEAVLRAGRRRRAGEHGAGDARQVAARRAGRGALCARAACACRACCPKLEDEMFGFGPDGLSRGRSPGPARRAGLGVDRSDAGDAGRGGPARAGGGHAGETLRASPCDEPQGSLRRTSRCCPIIDTAWPRSMLRPRERRTPCRLLERAASRRTGPLVSRFETLRAARGGRRGTMWRCAREGYDAQPDGASLRASDRRGGGPGAAGCSMRCATEMAEHPLLDLIARPNPRQGGAAFPEALFGASAASPAMPMSRR